MSNEKIQLLGLTGNIGSGKTTVMKLFKYSFWVDEYSFSEPLKKIAINLGFLEKEVYGTQEDKVKINNFWGISGREFLQKFGTDICREILPEKIKMNYDSKTLWIRLFEKYLIDYKNTDLKSGFLIVSDVRFFDEADIIKKYNGFIVKIERENNKNFQSEHKSEKDINEIKPNVVLRNNGTIDELREKIWVLNSFIRQGFLNIPNSTLYM